jgi:hypothetical protein
MTKTLIRRVRYGAYELGLRQRPDKLFEVFILDRNKDQIGSTGSHSCAEGALAEARRYVDALSKRDDAAKFFVNRRIP